MAAMKHLMICSEYPPAAGGGIGTYTYHMARLLAKHGEVVHIIGQLCPEAPGEIEYSCDGRLIVHRLPFLRGLSPFGPKINPAMRSMTARKLFKAGLIPQSFSWQAASLAEQLIATEKIDIIEGQEFEAPLHFLQYRRSCPRQRSRSVLPPICVHFHSPTEFVTKWNELDANLPYFAAMKRFEDFSVGSADGYLCPSKFLAEQMIVHYGLASDDITVIPYPLGDTPMITRSPSVWKNGSILYVGRLERRKGILEWLKAAVEVAGQWPDVHFEFIGENVLGTATRCAQEVLGQLIPQTVSKRFHFRGRLPRQDIPAYMAKARMAVVPSRWENFPYSAIEQMSSGLPLIVSPQGGMGEMVKDGHSGWLASEMSSDGLAAALVGALRTEPERMAVMGKNAASGIRALCSDHAILTRHMNYKHALVARRWRKRVAMPGQSVSSPIAEGIFFDVQDGFVPFPYTARLSLRKIVSLVKTGMISPQATIFPAFSKYWQNSLPKLSRG